MKAVGREDMIIHASGVRGVITAEEKIAVPPNNDVLKVGGDRSVWVLM